MDDELNANRQLWKAWTTLHEASEFYDLPGFKAGELVQSTKQFQ